MLSPTYLNEQLRYDPETGALYWKVRKKKRNLQLRAGNYDHVNNRWSIFINGKRYLQHRVIWAMEKGYWPEKTIDHKDRNSANNRWNNLQEATESEQQQNTKERKDSMWGRNITYDKTCDCFRVVLVINEVKHSSRHETHAEAKEAAEHLRTQHHPNRRPL